MAEPWAFTVPMQAGGFAAVQQTVFVQVRQVPGITYLSESLRETL